jgi:hypothetical protein
MSVFPLAGGSTLDIEFQNLDIGKVSVRLHLGPGNFDGSVEPGTTTVEPKVMTARLQLRKGTKLSPELSHLKDVSLDFDNPNEIDCGAIFRLEGRPDEHSIIVEPLEIHGSFKMMLGLSIDKGIFAAYTRTLIDAEFNDDGSIIERVNVKAGHASVNLKSSVLIKPEGDETVVYSLDGIPEVELPSGTIVPLEKGSRIVMDEEGTVISNEQFDLGDLDTWWETDDMPSSDTNDDAKVPVWFSKNFPFLMPLIRPMIPNLPPALVPLLPYLVLGIPAVIVIIVLRSVLKRRR